MKWQARWEAEQTYAAKPGKEVSAPKFYGLIEFPYPSGEGLHVGHPRSYTAIDVVTRKQRMEGKNVLYPIGWDAFGLPTENFAIKHKIRPEEATKKNVANFTRQIKSLGFGFDWSREVDTTDPTYYKWTQWQFLQFVKAGLAYKATSTINWCPKDKIGLANEEAQGGVCERCGTAVEKREKAQWMIKITKYADRLIEDLKDVNYLDQIASQQVNWIGKSEGANIQFSLKVPGQADDAHSVTVFTTRPDTIFGVTFLLISPELAKRWLDVGFQASESVKEYVANALTRPETDRSDEGKAKTGVDTGVYAINPVSGEEVPVWIADYVLGGYGTGAIMAVPAHDERDFAFATAYHLPVKQVVAPYVLAQGDYAPRADKATGTRLVTSAIIRHATTGKYLVLDMKDGRRGFPGGGIEAGETEEEAIRREIREETGYETIISLKKLFDILGHGYKPKKDANCFDPDALFEVVVDGEPTHELAEEDKTGHTLVWKEASEVKDFINLVHHQYAWNWMHEASPCFTEEGVACKSDFLNGLKTGEAKTKMIEWLEEKGVGKRATTYRLRDWVFSRQRYWGEPIPLVHCDACETKKQKVLLIHGFQSRGTTTGYLKKALEAKGFEVIMPTMSTKDVPVFETWMKELTPYVEQLGEQDMIIGHSLGGHAAVSVLAQLKKRIGSLILVAPAIGDYSNDAYWNTRLEHHPEQAEAFAALRTFLNIPVDLEAVSELADRKVVAWSSDDTLVPRPTHAAYPAGWYLSLMEGQGHFNRESQDLIDLVLASKNTGWIPVPDAALPLTLPPVEAYEPTDTGESPLAAISEWVNTTCPVCQGPATRETDTMPNWAGSSWYFLRYCDPKNDKEFASAEALKYWMPVDLYNGGMEHTTLHLLYSRFWHKFLWDMGHIPSECGSEPYRMRRSHNMILGDGGIKMSKSKGNVVNPDDVVKEYGADVLRVYEMFIGPYDQMATWQTSGIEGVRRFLEKVWNIATAEEKTELTPDLERLYHQTVKKIGEDIERLQFNTCISQLMILTNAFQDAKAIPESLRKGYLQLLTPFAPHLANELWEKAGYKEDLHHDGWPTFDVAKLVADRFELVIQINGKIRDRLTVSASITEEEAKKQALASETVQKWLEGKEPKKMLYIPGKLLTIVL